MAHNSLRPSRWLCLLALCRLPLASSALLRPAPLASRTRVAARRPSVTLPPELELAVSAPPPSDDNDKEPESEPPSLPDLAAGPLRAHQIDARDRVLAHWDGGGRRSTVVMPGGSGKTVCGLSIAEAAVARSQSASPLIIVAVPSIELITQTAREWRRWRPPLQQWVEIAVRSGSESGVVRLRPTTDESEIRGWLADGAERELPVVVYSTYNSLHRVAIAMGEREADLVIFDEAHTTAGRPDKFAAFGLEDGRLRAARRVFMTATPRRFERSLTTGSLQVHSMDDEGVYGPVRARWCRASSYPPLHRSLPLSLSHAMLGGRRISHSAARSAGRVPVGVQGGGGARRDRPDEALRVQHHRGLLAVRGGTRLWE